MIVVSGLNTDKRTHYILVKRETLNKARASSSSILSINRRCRNSESFLYLYNQEELPNPSIMASQPIRALFSSLNSPMASRSDYKLDPKDSCSTNNQQHAHHARPASSLLPSPTLGGLNSHRMAKVCCSYLGAWFSTKSRACSVLTTLTLEFLLRNRTP